MGEFRVLVHQGPGYIQVVDRHLFPYVYHKEDKTKIFCAIRASRSLAMTRLRANYPYQMYAAVGNKVGQREFKVWC